MWGAETLDRAREKMTDFRGSHIVPGVGHWVQQEAPDLTNRLLIEFLRQL